MPRSDGDQQQPPSSEEEEQQTKQRKTPMSDSSKPRKGSYARNKPGMDRVRRHKSEKYHGNILKRGKVSTGKDKKKETPKMNKWLVGLFVFVVIGSAIFQIISQAQQGSIS